MLAIANKILCIVFFNDYGVVLNKQLYGLHSYALSANNACCSLFSTEVVNFHY